MRFKPDGRIRDYDHYPFGMMMPGRKFDNGSQYRYGFNGKENDKDISEGGQDYGMRIYDTRVGRFLSVDPLTKEYPWYTPYQFAGNKPIRFIDRDGEEESDPGWFNRLMWWCEKPDWSPFEKGGAIAEFNDNYNPIGILYNHGCKIITGKDRYGTPNDYRGRMGAFTDFGTDVILYITGERVFKVVLGPKNSIQVLEQQALKNEAALGGTKSTVTPSNPKLTQAEQLVVNKEVSKLSEDIVDSKLTASLKPNEILLKKPRFYIGKGKKYAVPDFAIYNKDTKQFVKIIDAKNGGADFTRAQKQLNQLGGRFEGSSRYPEVSPQAVKPNMLTKEKTNLTY